MSKCFGSELRSEFLGCNDEESATLWLDQRPELLERDSDGCTVLQWVAFKGYAKICAQLLAQRPELANVVDSTDWTALHYAAWQGREAVVTQLLASRVLISTSEWTVLDCALQNGHDKIVGQLLDHCPELIETVKYMPGNGFHVAAERGHDKAIAQVLARRPKFTPPYCSGPLHAAAREGHDKVIALFHDYDPAIIDASCDGFTALHGAVPSGRANIVAQLLAYSPKLIDVVTSNGTTPLHWAISSKCGKVLELLLACKPELIDAVNSKGETPLQFALRSQDASLAAVDCLITAKPEQAYHIDREGNTLLHHILQRSHVFGKDLAEKVWRLNPAAVRVADKLFHWTPFDIAIHSSKTLTELFVWEFSLEEIARTKRRCPLEIVRPAVDQQFEALVVVLGRDVANIVHQYFWIERPMFRHERMFRMHLPPSN